MQRLQAKGLLPETAAQANKVSAGHNTAKRRYYWLGGTAMAALLAGALLLLWPQRGGQQLLEKRHPNMVMTRPGSRTKLILPDGTTVWLNASSKLTYGDDFMEKERRVQLEGEAYFDVVKNDSKPFIINTAIMNVRVLGTSLNVRYYAGDKKAETVLIKGKIEVQVKRRPQERYLLSSLEKLSVAATAPDVHPKKELSISNVDVIGKDSTIAETAWIDNELIFTGEPLAELAGRMERWFDVKVTVKGIRLQQFRMSGSFKDESPEQALKAISLITGCKYRLKDHVALLYDEE
jgi:ferric-dicitrate binding protein FerR (iron transport regulator)